jgi:hypothetical protein
VAYHGCPMVNDHPQAFSTIATLGLAHTRHHTSRKSAARCLGPRIATKLRSCEVALYRALIGTRLKL